MRIGGATDPREMPALNILEDERLMSTIGTDDPGVFGTNIEYEYALIEDALIKKNGWPRHQAVALLNRARRASIYGIYWPDYRGAYCEN
jgi:adenosine deaminase